MTKNWKSLAHKEVLRIDGRLRVWLERVGLPDGREIDDYLQISTPEFVVVVAQTADGRIICERQYKHGPKRLCLTLPAGSIDPGEDRAACAKRELLEETGYASKDWQYLTSQILHANAGGCWAHAFLARGCRKIAEPDSGDLEEMTIELVSPDALLAAHAAGEMPLISDTAALLPGLIALGILGKA